ncbi:exophilin-5 isoform X2 [Choloepus didactylus]|uniref:exophilin-5 isoform X2 n=1 Tax=Choloepus didactylus TaxID=27675 RepID=UPI00189E0E74|nr:exophilin-5 isoform X2 [Choloepus didactylus]
MTKVPQGFDFSFLNDEEARKILQVLERNEELQRAEKDRISKLQKTKRDIRWLQGVTGEWFEEIQRKKFCNETDISQMLKQPLTYRLRKGMAKNGPMESQTSRYKNPPNQKNPISIPSRLSFRSSFASLFSFRKSGKETLKLQSSGQKGCEGLAGPPVSVRGAASQAKIYSSPLKTQPVGSTFVPEPAVMRAGSSMPPWDASLLENEFFRDDLDSKLAQEQSPDSVNTKTPLNYGSRTQFSHFYSGGNRHSNIPERHKNHYNETSNMSIYDILRPGTPREGFKTFSPRTRTIYDMYRTREPRVLKEDYLQNNTFGSTSLCFDNRQRSASPATGHFTARSLHIPAITQNRNGFIPQSHRQSPKRTPLSSIVWNRSDSFRDGQNQEEFLRLPSPMEIDPADQCMHPRCFQENRRYEFYHSQNVYQSVSLNAPVDNAMNPDPFENTENMPFHHQDNPFARSFFSNTFGRSRDRRFGQSPSWGQQEEYFSWSDFHRNNKPFVSSDRDFEMISTEANSASAVHGHCVPSQYWRSFSPCYGPNVPRDQDEPCPWQFDFQRNTLERMEVSQGNGSQSAPHVSTSNVCPVTGSSYHIKPGGLEYQQDNSPIEVYLNEDAYSFGITQAQASSFESSFPRIPDKKGNPHSSNVQNPTVTLQKTIPSKPDCVTIESHIEVIATNSESNDFPPLTESQPNVLVTNVNNEKDLNESISEKGKQLNKMNQTNMTGEIPQPVSQVVISNPLPDLQTPHSQDPDKNKTIFNASTTVSSKRSRRIFSRKDTSKISISHRDKVNELKKQESFTGNRELGSAMSLPFIQESRTSPSFPSSIQSCHQELTVNNGDISSIIKDNHWSSEPTNIQNPQSLEKPVILDTEGKQCTTTHSTTCRRSTDSHSVSCNSLGLPSDAPQNSSPSNTSFLDALVIPSSTVISRRPSEEDPSLGEREENNNAGKNQNNQFAISPSEIQKSNDGHVPIYNEVGDIFTCHSSHPFRDRKGKGKIRRRISCIEKLSKIESRSTPTSDNSTLDEVNQGDSEVPDRHVIYCTLPRKSSSFLINNKESESKIKATSFRNVPYPFQIKISMEEPTKKDTSNKFNSTSPEFSKVASDSVPIAPAAAEKITNMKSFGSASVRKGSLPFLIKRAVSCPSGETYSLAGRNERKKCSVSNLDASVTPRPWDRIIYPMESDSSVRDCSFTKIYHQKEYSEDCTENDSKIAAFGTGVFPLSNEHPFSSDMSGKTLHKYKTTSTFSVSGDEDNVKCLEVVSIYYTLPRKPSKKFCDLLQKYTQNTDSLAASPKVETEIFSNALEKDKLNCSTQGLSERPPPEDLNIPAHSAQENNHHLSQTIENNTVLLLPNSGPLELPLQEMASVEADVSLYKGESKSREIFPDNFAKATQGDSLSRKERGEKMLCETLNTSSVLLEKKVEEGKSENCQQSIKSGNDGPSSLPTHSEDNAENPQAVRCSGKSVGSGTDITSAGNSNCPQKDAITKRNSILETKAVDDSSSGSQCREVRGRTGTDCQKMTNKALSDSESQVFALISTFHKLQLDEESCSGKPDLESLQPEPKEIPPKGLEVNVTQSRKAKDEMYRLTKDQTSLPEGSNENKTSLNDLEKGKKRSSVKHKLAAMSKASRKFPAKDLSPRRHVATIFQKDGSISGMDSLSLGTPESNALSPDPSPTPAESTEGSRRLSNDAADAENSDTTLRLTVISNRESSAPLSDQNSVSISQPHWNEFKNISESTPKNENSKDVTVAHTLERESGAPAQPTFTNLGDADVSDSHRRLSPPFPLEPAWKSLTISIPLAGCQQQQKSASSPEWEPEPHFYRSKSLKSMNAHGDPLRKSHPPKIRERHFSESTSIDEALSRLTLGNEFSINNGYSQRFRSFSELPSRDEKESSALYSDRTKTGPKSATSISRPIDYGIFGKEQQLAFLENVKRSLTQGRLWKPTFLKNPGFLRDGVINSPNTSESLSSNPPSRMPQDDLSPSETLKIYEEDPVDSDCGSDTTTDDEYYLDENDKESEL